MCMCVTSSLRPVAISYTAVRMSCLCNGDGHFISIGVVWTGCLCSGDEHHISNGVDKMGCGCDVYQMSS
jgi:hypothetical protein